jgi:hypothetical protein
MEGCQYYYTWDGEEVLFLAGDIHTKNRHVEILRQVPPFVKIYFVAGNHEYYGQDFLRTKEFFTNLHTEYPNFTFLDNEYVTVGDIEIFGGTMFTEWKLKSASEAGFAQHAAKDCIADFYHIKKDGKPWTTIDHQEEHQKFLLRFKPWLKATEGKKRIVVTHFMPTEQCCNIRFAGNILNPYFAENMERFFGLVDFWLCGHGHDTIDLVINDTRIVMNPKGYDKENQYGFKGDKVYEI